MEKVIYQVFIDAYGRLGFMENISDKDCYKSFEAFSRDQDCSYPIKAKQGIYFATFKYGDYCGDSCDGFESDCGYEVVLTNLYKTRDEAIEKYSEEEKIEYDRTNDDQEKYLGLKYSKNTKRINEIGVYVDFFGLVFLKNKIKNKLIEEQFVENYYLKETEEKLDSGFYTFFINPEEDKIPTFITINIVKIEKVSNEIVKEQ